jgi:hypothetical protein
MQQTAVHLVIHIIITEKRELQLLPKILQYFLNFDNFMTFCCIFIHLKKSYKHCSNCFGIEKHKSRHYIQR